MAKAPRKKAPPPKRKVKVVKMPPPLVTPEGNAPKPRPMGRPTKLTPELRAAIVEAVEQGNYPEVAAMAHGLARDTYYGWMERGRKGEQPFSDFSDALTHARATAEKTAIDIVRIGFAHNDKGAERAQWYLERTSPDRWGRRDKVVVENTVREELTAAVEKLRAHLPPDEFNRVLDVLATDDDRAGDARSAEGDAGEPLPR